MRHNLRHRIRFSLSLLLLLPFAAARGEEVKRTVAAWPAGELGNHRVRLAVEQKADLVSVHVPWRRRDAHPDRIDTILVDAATKKRVANVLRVRMDRESGELLFQPPTAPGEYYLYFMPCRATGAWWSPTTVYPPPRDTADAAWKAACEPVRKDLVAGKVSKVPAAKVLEIQANDEFNRFDPMEVIATSKETEALLKKNPDRLYLLFPEDRRYPIRMTAELPSRWIQSGPSIAFKGEACRGEFYAFQIGVWACRQKIENIAIEFGDLAPLDGKGHPIPATALRCFNLGGKDWLGRPLHKTVNVPQGAVQPLWLGVQVPRDATPGTYRGTLTLRTANAPPTRFEFMLAVSDKLLKDGGDSEIWRHSRLRWLDSSIGLDDEVFAPYTPVKLDGQTVSVLGRQATLAEGGLLGSIATTFTPSVDDVDGKPRQILAEPMRLVVEGPDGPLTWNAGKAKIVSRATGAVAWEAVSKSGDTELLCRGKMECDGYANFKLTLRAGQAMDVKDVRLEIPLRRDVATYMMGMGRKGGYRPKEWKWKWDAKYSNNQLWIGDVNAGLSCKLKHVEDRWDLHNLKETGVYRDWGNEGKGGCTVREEGDRVVVRAYTGRRAVAAGQELQFNFGLLITPVKTLDKAHWNWRYFHSGHGHGAVKDIAAAGATIANIHQGDALIPNINYPFLAAGPLAKYISDAHARNVKIKMYYTIRELSNYAAEFWALRSLGAEIFTTAPGFHLADSFLDPKQARTQSTAGGSWLCEHVVNAYVPAWHTPLPGGRVDASLATTGLSRWHNYYLEGLAWMIENAGVDGLYLDGVGYDREIMKRVRKVMDRTKRGCLIDFHSGNNFHPDYGLANCANQYLELFPFVDSLWFGEGFNYNESPDYWLVEIAGIPYGLFGEMLHGGGNPWRGMVYGMTNRLGWSGDPKPLWKLWDSFGIHDAKMIGYWDAACPVKCDRKDVLATAYVKKGKTLVALASWAKEPLPCRLTIDWKSLGLDPRKTHLFAPAVSGLQTAALYNPTDDLPVMPGRGCLLVLDEEKHEGVAVRASNAYEGRKLLLEDRLDRRKLDADWKTFVSTKPKTSLKPTADGLAIEAPANCFCFAERALPPGCTLAECRLFSGTDGGATWGPGLALIWKNKALRVNLRAEGRFGVDDGAGQTFGGVVAANTWFHVRIRVEPAEVIAEASRDGKLWYPLHALPRSQFHGAPVAVRLGKMNGASKAEDFSNLGAVGDCATNHLRIYGK